MEGMKKGMHVTKERINFWGDYRILSGLISGLFTALLIGFFAMTYQNDYTFILLGVCVILMIFASLIFWKIWKLWWEKSDFSRGRSFRLKVVSVFSSLVLAPSIITVVFSILFLNTSVHVWFHNRIKTAIIESQNVAQAYLHEHQKVVEQNILSMASGLENLFDSLVTESPISAACPHDFFQKHQKEFDDALTMLTTLRSLGEAGIFFFDQGRKKVVARSRFAVSLEFRSVPPEALAAARTKGISCSLDEKRGQFFALVPVFSMGESFLWISKPIDPEVLQCVTRAVGASQKYQKLVQTQGIFLRQSLSVFIGVSLIFLLIAVWAGLVISRQLITPITYLISASESVKQGELLPDFPENATRISEMSMLVRTFQAMISQVAEQQKKLMDSNHQLQMRTHFIESVLAGISSGVMSLTKQGKILLSNQRAQNLLKRTHPLEGKKLQHVAPEFSEHFARAVAHPGTFWDKQLAIPHLALMVNVHVYADPLEDDVIVTFDDIGDLLSAQKKAAWADVASRIAHEIKNPLTPIRLSAERMKRKYGQNVHDPDTFHKCVETIIRQVSYIGTLISEFSLFARMPHPVFSPQSLVVLAQHAIFAQKQAFPHITFTLSCSLEDDDDKHDSFICDCDGQKIDQVLTNLLKNAAEALEEAGTENPTIEVVLSQSPNEMVLVVQDNGPGFLGDLPFTEPYVTSKPSGTGLGLAIVKKIVEDHQGQMTWGNRNESLGACMRISFPRFRSHTARKLPLAS